MNSFPSVDHEILYRLLARRIADAPTLRLCKRILASGAGIHDADYRMQWFPDDDLWAVLRSRGLPIGNQTSQFWINVYLHELDMLLKQTLHCPAYVRYCDDFLLFAADKSTLHHWRREIESFLATLRMVIHQDKSRIYPVTCGIPFLGFTIFPHYRRLKRANGVAFGRRWKQRLRAYAAGRLPKDKLEAGLRAWIAHAAHGNTYRLRASLISRQVVPQVKPARARRSRDFQIAPPAPQADRGV